MAKLDEIAELLTEEIRSFETSVNRLEKLQQEIKTLKIQPDSSGIDHILKGYNDSQKKVMEEQNKLLANVIYHTKRSMALPKWSVKLFWALSVIILLILVYALFQVSRISEKEEAAFSEGESNAVRHYERFMEENAEAGVLYEEWRNAKGKK
ncbi:MULTISPECIES: DUF6730 family protein [Flagellimonas]|jgi:t-SNARE complex subunit (syntaxin)|uniref:Uncharacterized protein n=2 Tax=Flagellimonas TaxID=444459 RepID=A0A3A1NMT3_9FLAO|nr:MULTISPECIES: DUF6730 family protein [Allomuricauda]NDV42672.1 hypothetical protein [Allomuricauda sediminis]RIV46014.1 hypothetical protein D2V05_05450 [Allomuricauda maritima]TXJ98780.1 hypothetical protein FQ017_05405 [Allomuricauda maritima]